MPSYEERAWGAIYLHWILSTISCMCPYYLFEFHGWSRVASEESCDFTLIRLSNIILFFLWKVGHRYSEYRIKVLVFTCRGKSPFSYVAWIYVRFLFRTSLWTRHVLVRGFKKKEAHFLCWNFFYLLFSYFLKSQEPNIFETLITRFNHGRCSKERKKERIQSW